MDSLKTLFRSTKRAYKKKLDTFEFTTSMYSDIYGESVSNTDGMSYHI